MQPTILIIDDNQDEALIAQMVLSKTGLDLRTEVTSSGKEGLAFLRSAKPQAKLILLDIKMPGMDGIEVLRIIRHDESLKSIPVVMVTNSDLESDEQEADKAGADGFLHKAMDLGQFKKDIERVLERWLDAKAVRG